MRKNLLVVLLLLTIIPSTKVLSQYVISESFEGETFPPTGWATQNITGTELWQGTSNDSYYGFGSAYINYDGAGGRDMLKTPRILNVQSTYAVSFWLKRQFDQPYPPDSMLVRISTTGTTTANFSVVLGKIDVANLPNNKWVKFTYSLSLYAGQNIYIAFEHKDTDGNGCFIDDVTIGAKPTADAAVDPGLKVLPAGSVLATGTPITLKDTIWNVGFSTIPTGTLIKMTANDGPVISSVATTAPIASGFNQEFVFAGANAFTPTIPGSYLIKVFADLPGDGNHRNDTAYYSVTVQTPVTSFPYFQNFTQPTGWATTLLWNQAPAYFEGASDPVPSVVGPDGKAGDTAMMAIFYDVDVVGYEGLLRSPLLNFTGVAKPIMNFYVSYTSFDSETSDSLQILVSTDGGLNFTPAPYIKSFLTTPTLATAPIPADGAPFIPTDATSWRHESVDLSAFANQPGVIIVFNAINGYGNYCYIDNVSIANQAPLYYYTAPVAAPGIIGPLNNKVTFLTTGNVAGGDIVFQGSVGTNSANNTYEPNTTATAPDGSIFTPDFVYPIWTTVTYSGNDSDRAVYNISIDITPVFPSILNPDKLYFMKRCDQSGAWVCLPTTRVGTVLSTAGLTNFSEFTIGSILSVNPVHLLSFEGKLVRDQVNLKWETANELNNEGFDIERKTKTSWEKVGYVHSQGNSTRNANYAFLDRTPAIGANYYRLKQTDIDGKETYSNIVKIDLKTSGKIRVFQNSPNPFISTTTIKYTLAEKSAVKIAVYSTDGKRIATLVDETKSAGVYETNWNATGLPAGTYYYKVITGDEVSTFKMLKVR